MTPQINIDDDVLEALKQQAVPFQDHEPNDVLRRLILGDHEPEAPIPVRAASRQPAGKNPQHSRPAKRKRAPSSTLLPETEYYYPILRVISDNGGRIPTSEAIAAVGELVKDKLLPADLEMLGKKPRWKGRVQFTRLQLIKDGLMKENSPRGVWEITDAGEKAVKKELRADTVASVQSKRAAAGPL